MEQKRMIHPTEEEAGWIRKIARGDEAAFHALFLRYRDRLIRYLDRMLHGVERAEEVFQETMLEVWRKARSFEGRSAPATWLYSIARHKALDRLRKRGEEPTDPEHLKQHPDPRGDPSRLVEQRHLAGHLRRALQALSPLHREVVELTYYQGCSMEEIAAIIGCPSGTVKTRMFHARQRLKAALAARGITEAEG